LQLVPRLRTLFLRPGWRMSLGCVIHFGFRKRLTTKSTNITKGYRPALLRVLRGEETDVSNYDISKPKSEV